MRVLAYGICILIAALLFRASADFPDWGDPNSPASKEVSAYYLEHAMHDTEVPNVVSAVLADYRGFDTMWETTVVLIAALAIIFLLRRSSYDLDYRPVDLNDSPQHNHVTIVVCRLLIPIMQIFALYVIIHGHHSPGGGFQGGVILGATLILHAMAFGMHQTLNFFSEKRARLFAYLGVIIFAGVGVACMIAGGNFLDYGALSKFLPLNVAETRSFMILFVEVGVALTVMSVMFSIYADLASAGDLDKGL